MDAQAITAVLNGKWYGGYGVAPCPVCQPEGRRDQNAMTVKDGGARLLLYCRKLHCAFADILASLGLGAGGFVPPSFSTLARRKQEQERQDARKALQAKTCWDAAQPTMGTVAEAYLRNRGINCSLPSSLRFHTDCWHGPSAQRLPAMIAMITCLTRKSPQAIHRTYLRHDGLGKADVSPTKMMLGAAKGGCVVLSDSVGPLVVAEGIETTLSLASGLLARPATIVAALSSSGMKGLALPKVAGALIIASDGDAAGREAAAELGFRAQASGWNVELLPAPDGMDWNDVLLAQQVEAS